MCYTAIYCLGELLEFAAFIWLRIKAPDLHRPYRVPLPTWGVILMLMPAVSLLVSYSVLCYNLSVPTLLDDLSNT
jgi:amino acid transporter